MRPDNAKEHGLATKRASYCGNEEPHDGVWSLGLETSPAVVARFGAILHVIDRTVLAVFVVELVSRFFVYRQRFFRDQWRVFDFLIVGIALMPASARCSERSRRCTDHPHRDLSG